jgi:hypothetical protein
VWKGPQSTLHVLAYTIDPSSTVAPVPIGCKDLELYHSRLITRVDREREVAAHENNREVSVAHIGEMRQGCISRR